MQESFIQRAQLLMQQYRYADAEKILQELLGQNPVDIYVLSLLSEVKLQLDKVNDAHVLADNAIGLSPDSSHLFYLKARIMITKEEYDQAENCLDTALKLEPDDADYYSLWASIKLTRKQYEKALELADRSLQLDPENLVGLNVRSTALLKLDRKDESFETIEGALNEDPNNAYTHTNYGWNLLEKGNHKKAREHFREALRSDPNYDYARAGMLEALKAGNPFYRLFLKYTFWMSNLTAKYQWGVILGFYFGTRLLNSLAAHNETLRPFLMPIVVLLAIIAFSTWVIMPLSNLMLRLSPYGKHLLTKKQILSSNFVGVSFVFFLLGLLIYLISGDEISLGVAAFGFAMMLPYGVMFSPSKYKHSLVIYAAAMTAIGLAALAIALQTGELMNAMTTVFLFGFIGFQFAANFLMIKESNV